MDVRKCIGPFRYTLNNRLATSPLLRLEERWEACDQPMVFSLFIWGGTEPNRTVTCMVLKIRLTTAVLQLLTAMNFVGLDMMLSVDQAA
ncbi:hypothetical protein TNCV_3617901 [Trichonephila clavipes]|nr:hypothetical protein TNCV_3617901 [Trichonephila clavipes]